MKRVQVNELGKFLNESVEYILCRLDEGQQQQLICSASYDLNGEFDGLQFGFIDVDMFDEMLDEMRYLGVDFKFAVALKVHEESRKMYNFKRDCEVEIIQYKESDDEELTAVMSREEAEEIYNSKELSEFKERLELIKRKVFKI